MVQQIVLFTCKCVRKVIHVTTQAVSRKLNKPTPGPILMIILIACHEAMRWCSHFEPLQRIPLPHFTASFVGVPAWANDLSTTHAWMHFNLGSIFEREHLHKTYRGTRPQMRGVLKAYASNRDDIKIFPLLFSLGGQEDCLCQPVQTSTLAKGWGVILIS